MQFETEHSEGGQGEANIYDEVIKHRISRGASATRKLRPNHGSTANADRCRDNTARCHKHAARCHQRTSRHKRTHCGADRDPDRYGDIAADHPTNGERRANRYAGTNQSAAERRSLGSQRWHYLCR